MGGYHQRCEVSKDVRGLREYLEGKYSLLALSNYNISRKFYLNKKEKRFFITDAIQYYTKAITCNPTQHKYYYQLALCHLALNKRSNIAIKAITKAIISQPDIVKYYQLRARCYVNIEEYEKAINDYNVIFDCKEIIKSTLFDDRALVHYECKDYKRALSYLNKAIELDDGKNIKYYLIHRANCYAKMKEYEKAINDYNNNERCMNRWDRFNRAVCYYHIKEYEKGIVDLTVFIRGYRKKIYHLDSSIINQRERIEHLETVLENLKCRNDNVGNGERDVEIVKLKKEIKLLMDNISKEIENKFLLNDFKTIIVNRINDNKVTSPEKSLCKICYVDILEHLEKSKFIKKKLKRIFHNG